MNWIIKLLLTGLALIIADYLLDSIHIDGYGTALLAALILGVINTIIRPILVFLTLPITILTLGIFILVINAITFYVTSMFLPGFQIEGFIGAFWGALIVGVISWILNSIIVKD